MAEGRPHSVVIVEDEPVLRVGLRFLLGRSRFLECVGEAPTGAEAVIRCEQFRPDVLLLDSDLPDMAAEVVCRRVLERLPETAIIVFTDRHNNPAVRASIDAGALGWLRRDVTEQALLAGLTRAACGQPMVGVPCESVNGVALRRGDEELTAREQDVIAELARGLTTREIGHTLGLSTNTVKSHLRRVFRKWAHTTGCRRWRPRASAAWLVEAVKPRRGTGARAPTTHGGMTSPFGAVRACAQPAWQVCWA